MNSPEVRTNVFRWLLGLVLGAAAIYLASRELSWLEITESFSGVRPGWLALAVLIAFAGQTVKAVRWRIMLSSEPNPPRLLTAWVFHLSGQLGNILMPGPAGDLGRIVVVGGRGQGRPFTAGTVALEKIVDLTAYAVLVIVLLILAPLLGPLPDWIVTSAAGLAGLAAFIAFGIWAIVRYRDRLIEIASAVLARLPPSWGARGGSLLRGAAASLNVLDDRPRLLKLALATGLIWTASVLINHAATLAFGLSLPLTASALLLAVLQAGVSTNLVPGTIGLFELLCVEALALYGVPRQIALSYGLALHAAVLAPLVTAAVIGALGGWRRTGA